MVDVPEEVVERARDGDLDAVRTILRMLEAPVFHTVFRLVGGRFASDVEDIAQEIFLKVFRSIGSFDPLRGVKFSTWVYTFVKNHCFDVLKKRRLPTVLLDDLGRDTGGRTDRSHRTFEVDARSRRPGDEVVAAEISARIAEAVAELSEDQRLVFVLREYQGLDYREIAEVAQCSEGTVKSRLHRAKDALRKRLRRYVISEGASGDAPRGER